MTNELLDLARYPMHLLEEDAGQALVASSRDELLTHGTFRLPGFLLPDALSDCVGELEQRFGNAYRHAQEHDVYFARQPLQPPPPQGVQQRLNTRHYTLTCDQLSGTVIRRVYEWPPLCEFLAQVFDAGRLYPMADPLARLNVMGYVDGDRLSWHFDRAKYTVTLTLQEAAEGGLFQYRRNLRSDSDPNYDGVIRLLAGHDEEIETLPLAAGTLNVFAGRYSPHCITPVRGDVMRMVAVLSFVDEPDYRFSAEDRRQFYGRAEPVPA